MKLTDVKNRKVFEGIEITNEVIRPVAEKWVDGLVHETDNLQLTIKSISEKPITDVMAYLYYYDANGKELGHEFDITDSKIKQGQEARLSFMLLPPDNFKSAEIELKAEYEEKHNYKASIIFFVICLAVIYGYELFKSA